MRRRVRGLCPGLAGLDLWDTCSVGMLCALMLMLPAVTREPHLRSSQPI